MRASHLLRTAPLALLLLAGCEGPARERGFFSGIGAAVTGDDTANVRRLEDIAASSERNADIARQRNVGAQQAARSSSADLRDAQAQLEGLRQTLRRQRETLAQLRARRSNQNPAAEAEGERLQAEMVALERQASVRDNASRASLRQMEQRAAELDAALRRYGSI